MFDVIFAIFKTYLEKLLVCESSTWGPLSCTQCGEEEKQLKYEN